MARKYPKFLLSNPSNSKSPGPFVIHTLEPRFIAKLEFNKKHTDCDAQLLEIWSDGFEYFDVIRIVNEIPDWYNYSGREQSDHPTDKLIWAIHQLEFLKDYNSDFSVEQVRLLIRILFPTKAKGSYEDHSSYGIKEVFSSISRFVNGRKDYPKSKYCSNDTTIKAFELEGFNSTDHKPNPYFNLSAKEANKAFNIFRYDF